jgi:hypothetical protein
MARPGKHETCVRCRKKARMCTYTSYYEVGKAQSNERKPRKGQLKGKLPPTKGYCTDCFLEIAKKRGLTRTKLQELRRQLSGARRSDSADGRRKRRGPRRRQ